MKSRYDFMTASAVVDEDGDTYPDPLSISYNDVQYTQIPTTHVVSAGDIGKFWYTMYKQYGVSEMDDVLLSLNGVPYVGMLEPGETIYFLDKNDIDNFSTQKQVGSE